MYKNYTLSVIIPAFNEEAGLAVMLPDMPQIVDQVIVVDNNSSDNTGSVAKKLGAKVIREECQGYGAAIRAGLRKANTDYIVIMDGDGTYPLTAIQELLHFALVEKYNFISADRFHSKYRNTMPLLNYIGNKILTAAVALLFHQKISDSQSGMMLFKRDILSTIEVASEQMGFSEEIKIRVLLDPHYSFKEFPISYHDSDRIGRKKLRLWKDGFGNLIHLVKLRFDTINKH